MKAVSLHLRERDVSQQVKDFLGFRGWRVFRNNVTRLQDKNGKWIAFGEPGMPDLLALHYRLDTKFTGMAACLWVEVKQPGGKPRPHQAEWHKTETAMGATVVVVDDFRVFEDWYWEEFGWVHQVQLGQRHLFQPLMM